MCDKSVTSTRATEPSCGALEQQDSLPGRNIHYALLPSTFNPLTTAKTPILPKLRPRRPVEHPMNQHWLGNANEKFVRSKNRLSSYTRGFRNRTTQMSDFGSRGSGDLCQLLDYTLTFFCPIGRYHHFALRAQNGHDTRPLEPLNYLTFSEPLPFKVIFRNENF
jgi:hypothetical protein